MRSRWPRGWAAPRAGASPLRAYTEAVEIVKDRATKEESAADEKVGARLHQAAQQRGLFSRLRGDVYCLAPPVVITTAELDQVIEALAGAIHEVLGT